MSRKKKEIHVLGLPEPWKAFYSDKRKRIFYFNTETKQSTWEISVVEYPLSESDLSTKQPDIEYQQRTLNILGKGDVNSRGNLVPENVGKGVSNKIDCFHCSNIPNTSESNEELMEIDEISIEGINYHEEPMEIDFVVEEVQAFRREHFLHPNLFTKNNPQFFHTAKNMEVCETAKNADVALIVFDTSCLLQDTTLLPMCTGKICCSLIPYTVLQELDGLKRAKCDELRSKAVKTVAYLHDCIKRGCNYLFIETTFEALNGMEEFGCQNNDDIILKCAFVTAKKYENESVRVVFATNDKNLAVKAAAHNIVTADRDELLHLLATDISKDKSQQFMMRDASQKISPSDFSFTLTDKDKPSSSTVKTTQITAARKVDIGSGDKLFKRKRLYELSGHCMDDFLDTFADLVQYLQRRKDKKSVEDTRRINKVIDSVIENEASSLSVLVDMVSKFYDFYADRNVFISATHFDKKKLTNEYENATNTIKEKLRTFQKQLAIHPGMT
ncbi:WW domain containing protein [Brugia malayi]|uniref:Bm9386 n=1 Tax=Brugia malayi TaxID=6279 RepID=A0A0K0JZ41_BRUMA|nr:WW domain containing protein [Brugia malayi]CRZ23672.1 Bm9386 [Brugia malayi]VIO92902.1 WW domain containing protein [Brugia malayi]